MAIRVVVRVLNPLFIYFLKTINKIVEQARNNNKQKGSRGYTTTIECTRRAHESNMMNENNNKAPACLLLHVYLVYLGSLRTPIIATLLLLQASSSCKQLASYMIHDR
jgi:hypothetical protein